MAGIPDLVVYALDIETDTSAVPFDPAIPAGLDPRAAAVISVAVCHRDGAFVLDDPDEKRLLSTLASWLGCPGTAGGLIATFNGSAFDMPFLAERAARHGVDFGMVLVPAGDARPPKYEALPGHAGGYFVRVGCHRHVDVAYPWRSWAAANDVAWGLKPIAKALGVDVVEVDRERVAELSPAERAAYNLSDVYATLALAERTPDLSAWVDPV